MFMEMLEKYAFYIVNKQQNDRPFSIFTVNNKIKLKFPMKGFLKLKATINYIS